MKAAWAILLLVAAAAAVATAVKPCGGGHGCADEKAVCCQAGEGYCCPHGFVCSPDGDAACFRDHSLAGLAHDLDRLEKDAVDAKLARGDSLTPAQEGKAREEVKHEAEVAARGLREKRVKELQDRLDRLHKLDRVAGKDVTYLEGVRKGLDHVKSHVKALHSLPPRHASKAARRSYARELKKEIAGQARAAKLLSKAYVAHQRGILSILGHKLHTDAHKTVRHGPVNSGGSKKAAGGGKSESGEDSDEDEDASSSSPAPGNATLPERRAHEHPMDHAHRVVAAPRAALKQAGNTTAPRQEGNATQAKASSSSSSSPPPPPPPDAPVSNFGATAEEMHELTPERVNKDAAEFVRHRKQVKTGEVKSNPELEREYANRIMKETNDLAKQEAEKKAQQAEAAAKGGAAGAGGSSASSSSSSGVADLTPEQMRAAVENADVGTPHMELKDVGASHYEPAESSSAASAGDSSSASSASS